nr:WecB/TagA/CpsF family glycosyltransferase [Azomonas macrocytogenes]
MACIRDWIKQPYSYLVTPNMDHLARVRNEEAFRDAYDRARLRLCDSRVIMPLLNSLGVHVKEVITGSDLTLDLLKWANEDHLRIVLIGSTSAECGKLLRMYPNIKLDHYNPPMGFIKHPEEVERCLAFIREHPSDLVFYAVGTPQGEILASKVQSHERTGMGIGIGASISFATGTVKRAPKWMQEARLEWLYRTTLEPRRLGKRYLNNFMFIIPAYLRERNLKSRKAANSAKPDH